MWFKLSIPFGVFLVYVAWQIAKVEPMQRLEAASLPKEAIDVVADKVDVQALQVNALKAPAKTMEPPVNDEPTDVLLAADALRKTQQQNLRLLSRYSHAEIAQLLANVSPFNDDKHYFSLLPKSNLTGEFNQLLVLGRSAQREQVVNQLLDQHYQYYSRRNNVVLCGPKRCMAQFIIDVERDQYFNSEYLQDVINVCQNKPEFVTRCTANGLGDFFGDIDLQSLTIEQGISVSVEFDSSAQDVQNFDINYQRFERLSNNYGNLELQVNQYINEQISQTISDVPISLVSTRCKNDICRALIKNGLKRVGNRTFPVVPTGQYCVEAIDYSFSDVLHQDYYDLDLNCSILVES